MIRHIQKSLFLGSLLTLFLVLSLFGSGPLDAAEKKAPKKTPAAAQPAVPVGRLFASPDEAGAALAQAAAQHDRTALEAILGGDAKKVLGLVDDPATIEELTAFAQAYHTRHEWTEANGFQILLIGEDQWPFPIPLARTTGRQWAFDPHTDRKSVV